MALRKKPPTTLLLTDMSSLYGYIYCMLISEGLSGMPLYGGALYMIGRVTTVFAQTFSPEEAIYLRKALRWMRVPLMFCCCCSRCALSCCTPCRSAARKCG